jgi:hypothetical protein
LSRPFVCRAALAGAAALAAGLAVAGPASAAGRDTRSALARPTDPRDRTSLVHYASPTVAWATPEGHFLVHYVADPADPDAPDLTDAVDYAGNPVPDGVPDYVEQAGSDAERAYAFEVGTLGYPPPPPDDSDGIERGGDGRFDIYIVDFSSHDQRGLLGLTTSDPQRSRFSYLDIDDDYGPEELAGWTTTSAPNERAVTIAHELFHAIQNGYSRSFDSLPLWLAEATATWMETEVRPDIRDNANYLPTLEGKGTELPLWHEGQDLHVYGSWWFIRYMTTVRPEGRAWVERLLKVYAEDPAHGHTQDELGLWALRRISGGPGHFAKLFRSYAVANLKHWFRQALEVHSRVHVRSTETRWQPASSVATLQARYYRFAFPGKKLTVLVQRAGGPMRRTDLALLMGGFKGAVVTRVQRLDAGTFAIQATLLPGRPHVATLVVAHADAEPAAYRVGARLG